MVFTANELILFVYTIKFYSGEISALSLSFSLNQSINQVVSSYYTIVKIVKKKKKRLQTQVFLLFIEWEI